MVKKLTRFLGLTIAAFSLAGCSVHEDVMYSVAEINGEVVSQWPYSKPGIKIHVRADNTKVSYRSSRVLGTPVETVTEPKDALIQPHTFYIAVKTEPGMNVSWDPSQLFLVYKNRKIKPMALSPVTLISFEAKCVSTNDMPSAAIALYDDRYICLKVEFDIDTIYPSEQFGLELFGFYMTGKTLEPIIFGFRGSEVKSIKL